MRLNSLKNSSVTEKLSTKNVKIPLVHNGTSCNKGKGEGRRFIMPLCVACNNSKKMNFNHQQTNWEKIKEKTFAVRIE